jgi:thiol-disulfide isomerase/thioredoxin
MENSSHQGRRAPGRSSSALGLVVFALLVLSSVGLKATGRGRVEGAVEQLGKLKVGQPVPDGELLTLRGEHLSISSLQGKTSLLEFGATWCGPCRSMLRPLRELANRSAPAVQIVSVDVGESQADVTAHYARRDTGNLRIALDPSGSVAQQLGVEAFPTLVLLDARGRVQLINVGAVRDMAPIAQRIESLQP